MPYRCANPSCRWDYHSMRAICHEPRCLDSPPPGCGRYFRILADGKIERLDAAPQVEDQAVVWLCCYCAMEYEPAGVDRLRIVPDPLGFIWRWQIENAESSVAHEGG